jgi:hypothetical protein
MREACPIGLSRSIWLPDPEQLDHFLGSGIWPAAFVLGDELLARPASWLAGLTILELGAGAIGYPGLVAALRGGPGTHVFLTDKHEGLVARLRASVDANGLASQCDARVYEWGEGSEVLKESLPGPPDLILASDCLYTHGSTGAFCDALDELCTPGTTRILVSAEERWSRQECIDICAEKGWRFTQLGGERRPSAAHLACVEKRMREMGEGRWYVYEVTRENAQESARPHGLREYLGCKASRAERVEEEEAHSTAEAAEASEADIVFGAQSVEATPTAPPLTAPIAEPIAEPRADALTLWVPPTDSSTMEAAAAAERAAAKARVVAARAAAVALRAEAVAEQERAAAKARVVAARAAAVALRAEAVAEAARSIEVAVASSIETNAVVDNAAHDDAHATSSMASLPDAPLQSNSSGARLRLDLGVSFEDAAGRLLSSQFSETCMEWLSTAGSYKALSASDCVLRQIAPCAACFENHLAIALPDSPPPFAIRPPTQKVPP